MIYFIKPRGRPVVKIGYARCVQERVETLQTASPDELVILGVIAGGLAKEASVQARFAHLRVRGEWFRYTREVRLFLRAEAEDYRPLAHDPEPHAATERPEWQASLAAVRPAPREATRRVRVWVARFPDRRNFMLQWADPDTNKRCSKSAGTANRDEAELRRADLEAALNQNRLCNTSRNTRPAAEQAERDGETQPVAGEGD